jgi:hypothetical protein
MLKLRLQMLTLLTVVAMIGCGVAIFFLRAKRKSPARSKRVNPGSHSRASDRKAYMGKEG